MFEFDLVTAAIVAVGLMQLPLLVDFIRGTFPQLQVPRLPTGRVMLGLTVAMASAGLAFFFLYFSPGASGGAGTGPAWLHAAFALYLWTAMACHYILAVVTPPNTDEAHAAALADLVAASKSTDANCRVCKAPKPAGVHHCRDCGRCVANMDHHCPFTLNCVGPANFSYFYFFLAFLLIGLSYGGALSFPLFRACWLSPVSTALPVGSAAECAELGTVSLTFVVVLGLWLAAGMLLGFHTFLLAVDLTTLELLSGQHSLGGMLQRFKTRPASRVRRHLLARGWVLIAFPGLEWTPLARPLS